MSRRVELVLLHGSSASIPLHLERMISSYLGPSPNMTLSETCTFGSIALLDWMWEASCTRASERTPWWSLTNFLRSDPHYYRFQFAKSMKVAAKRGDLAVVGWLLQHFQGCVVRGEAVRTAAYFGHLHILRLLWHHDGGRLDREKKTAKKRKVVTSSGEAVSRSSSVKNVVRWEGSTAVDVCHPAVARWLHEHFPPKSEVELEKTIRAAVNVDLELAKFLLPPGRCLLDYAESSTNPDMIEWMSDCGYLQRDTKVAVFAIQSLAGSSDNLPLMQRIADQHKQPEGQYWFDHWSDAMDEACKRGQLETFQWLAEHPTGVELCVDFRQEESICDFAALVLQQVPADVDFLQYLYEQDLFVEDDPYPGLPALPDAINSGQPLEVLKWIVYHTDPERLPGYCVMDKVAASGRLEILQYFHRLAFTGKTVHPDEEEDTDQNPDAPLWCTTKAMDEAAANGHFKVVKWLHVSRPEGCTVAAMDGAARNGHLGIVKWLQINRSEGCTEAAMDGAAENGHLETVKWLQTNTSAGCTASAMRNAAFGGHLETLKWLHGHTSEGCTVNAINNALRFRHFRVASWLHEHFPQYVPTKLSGYFTACNTFEELLFREEHYGDIFTSQFLRQLRNPGHRGSSYERDEVCGWAMEKYLGR